MGRLGALSKPTKGRALRIQRPSFPSNLPPREQTSQASGIPESPPKPLPFFSSESQTLNRRHCGYAQGPEVLCLQESERVLPGGTPVHFILAQLTEGMALRDVKEKR